MTTPSKKNFIETARKGRIPPLYEEMPYAPPRLIYERFASTNSFLLESVKGPENIARYSFIGFDPCCTFMTTNGVIETEPGWDSGLFENRPLRALKALLSSYKQKPFAHLPPFQGGLVGILGYDFVHYLESLPQNATDDLHLPDSHFLLINKLIAFDHIARKCWVIVCPGVTDSLLPGTSPPTVDWSQKYDEAERDIATIAERVKGEKSEIASPKKGLIRPGGSPANVDIVYEMRKKEYMDIVRRTKEYIAAGDIFQANLSQRLSAPVGAKSPWNLYRILSDINPSPFAAFLDFGYYQIVSSSPERLLRIREGVIETRPIAGTRPRGKDGREDELMRKELLLNEKERAEHIMLIDLERNDLGRVSQYGTVRVDELMITEDYSHVIHIVSNVTGDLAPRKDCFDAIRATFPGGTITGVPKVRCMEIIDELEPVKRGPYTGSIGYIGFSGNMDLNIVIRSFVISNGRVYVQAGAGIVADSDPEKEYFESLKKAEALIKTLEKVRS
jgi:anthranilate/para-aminobenzoate synthase component I